MLLALLLACTRPADPPAADTGAPLDTAGDTGATDSAADSAADSDTADSGADSAVDTDTAPPDGGALYVATCVECHGADGRGTDEGPEILTALAEYPDAAILQLILIGYDRMPAQDLTAEEAQAVIDWMRANLQ